MAHVQKPRLPALRISAHARHLHGGVLNAPNGVLIVDAPRDAAPDPSPPVDGEPDHETRPRRQHAITVAIWVLSLLVLTAFGFLATFMSPLLFLGAILPFIPLGVLTGKSS